MNLSPMRDPKTGRFISTTKIILPPGNRGRRSRALSLAHRPFNKTIKRKPHAYHLSDKPRYL